MCTYATKPVSARRVYGRPGRDVSNAVLSTRRCLGALIAAARPAATQSISPSRGAPGLTVYILEIYYRGASRSRSQVRRPTVSARVVPEFEWDDGNEEHLLDSHGVTAYEAESCFANPHTKKRSGDRFILLGKTDEDRMLFLVYLLRPDGRVRVISGREMEPEERRAYRRDAR